MDLLLAFNARYPRMPLGRLAESAGLPKPTARRLAATLIDLGFLRQGPDGEYSLGGRNLELGALVSRFGAVAESGLGIMRSIRELTGHTVLACEMDWADGTWLITHRLDGVELLDIAPPVGTRRPIGGGVMERAALAGLPQAEADRHMTSMTIIRRTDRSIADLGALRARLAVERSQGFSIDDEEFVEGYRGVATALMSGSTPVGAVCVLARTTVADLGHLDTWGRVLAATRKA